MNKKGFTLIELLAVIVILAIIALIATPLLMNVVNDSKKGGYRASAYEYIKAVETEIVKELVKNDDTFDINKYLTEVQPNIVKGTKPDSVNLTVDASGNITGGSITVGGITFVANEKGELIESSEEVPSKTWKEKTGQLYTMTANTTGTFTVTGLGGTNAWKAFDNSTGTSVSVNRDTNYEGTIMFGKAVKIKEMAFAAAMYNGIVSRAEGGESEYGNSITVNGIKEDGTKVSRIISSHTTVTSLTTALSTSEEEFAGIEVIIGGTSYMSTVFDIQITKWLELE